MNKDELFNKIKFEIEHQIYDLIRNDDEDNAAFRAEMAFNNIQSLLKQHGYDIIQVEYPERDCSVYINKRCNCKEGQCDNLMY